MFESPWIPKGLILLAGLLSATLGMLWLRVVLFTNFREHLHGYIALCAVVSLVIALGLFMRNRWVLAASCVGAFVLLVSMVALQIYGRMYLGPLFIPEVFSVLYLWYVIPFVRSNYFAK